MSDALGYAIKSVNASCRDEHSDGVLTIGGERALVAEIEHLRKQIERLIGGLIDQTVRADEAERDALSLVDLALSQHSDGPAVAAMRIAGNGPTIGDVVRRALVKNPKPSGNDGPAPTHADARKPEPEGAGSDARDAARYRYLRGDEPGCEGLGKAYQGDPSFYPYVVLHDPVCVDITSPLLKEELDAAVDRAIATPMASDGAPTVAAIDNAALRIAPGSAGDGAPLKVPQGANGQAISDSREESGTSSNLGAAPK